MRILQVINDVNPQNGGVAEAVRLISLELERNGHTVEILSLDAPDSQYISNFPFVVNAIGPGKFRYGYTSKLRAWIRVHARRFDVAIVNGLWNHAVVGGGRTLLEQGLPYVLYTHGMLSPWFRVNYPAKHLLKQIFWSLFQGKVLTHAEKVIFTTLEEKSLVEGAFYGYEDYKKEVVTMGCSAPNLHILNEAEKKFRSSVPSLGEAKYLLFLSRIHPVKGCDLLVQAFADFAQDNTDCHLVVAGPDQAGLVNSLRDMATSLGIQDCLHFPGMLHDEVKWGAFLGAEAFILPSHQENFGIVVVEALGCGTPILTTNKVNIWREIINSGAGLVEEDTQQGITELLARWGAFTLDEKNQMGICAQQCFEKHFQLEAAANGLLDILESVSTRA